MHLVPNLAGGGDVNGRKLKHCIDEMKGTTNLFIKIRLPNMVLTLQHSINFFIVAG